MKNCLFALIVLVIVATSSLAEAIIVGEDNRRLVPSDDRVNSSTVAIVSGGGTDVVCSGTTIGVAHVITAAHCLYRTGTQELRDDLTVIARMHLATDYKPAPRFHIKRIFILKNYIQDLSYNGYTTYAASKDIAIIQVREFRDQEFFNDQSRIIPVAAAEDIDLQNTLFAILSYGVGNGTINGAQYYQHGGCRYRGPRYNYTAIEHDCDTEPGVSGMSLVTDENYRVVAVHTGAAGGNEFNSAALITSDILPEINKITMFEYDDLQHFQVFDYNEPTFSRMEFKNNCNVDVLVAARFVNMDNQWETRGFYTIAPGDVLYYPFKILDDDFYLVAYTSDRSRSWTGSHGYNVRGDRHEMMSLSFKDWHTDERFSFSCD